MSASSSAELGVDAASDGWIVAEFLSDGFSVWGVENLKDVERPALVDVPIGLPESSERQCDSEARSFLAPQRHYSVFSCPVRRAVYADSYEEACEINEGETGKRISRQTWNIVPDIKEAYRAVSSGKEFYECHPEVVFKKLDEYCVEESKLTDEGFRSRVEALSSASGVSEDEMVREAESGSWGRDDGLDAMALAYAAGEDIEPIMARG